MLPISQFKAIISLCILYFLQGIPYGVQVKALPMFLYSSMGLSMDTSTRTALLMMPWVFCKPLLAIAKNTKNEHYYLLHGGILISAFLNLCMFIFANQWEYLSQHLLFSISAIVLFMINVASVCIDIATDNLAISSALSGIDLKFLGISNSIQVVAYKVGAMFGGVFLSQVFEIQKGFLAVVALNLISILILPRLLSNSVHSQGFNKSGKYEPGATLSGPKLQLTFEIFCLVLYIVLYKLGENGASTIFPLLAINKGIQQDSIALFSSLVFEPLSLLGSILGGVVWSMFTPKNPMQTLCIFLFVIGLLRIIPLVIEYQCLITTNWVNLWPLGPALLSLLGGAMSTLTFTLMMTMTHRVDSSQRSSLYAVLSSIEVCGKLLFSSYVGALLSYFGLHVFVVFCGLVVLPTFVLLPIYRCLVISHQNKLKLN